jgi:hypothetical protein
MDYKSRLLHLGIVSLDNVFKEVFILILQYDVIDK